MTHLRANTLSPVYTTPVVSSLTVTDPKIRPFAGCTFETQEPTPGSLCLLGLPCDSQSSYRRGPAEAPPRIRQAFNDSCYNATTEMGVDLDSAIADLGDISPGSQWTQTRERYRTDVERLLEQRSVPFILGGDHAISIPVVEAYSLLPEPVHVIQFDAHADLYPEFQNSRFSHACTGARLLEMDHVASLTVIGVRTLNPMQQRQIKRFRQRLAIHEARHLTREIPLPGHIPPGAAVYVTLDLDVFDPAHAPGLSHPVPGGLRPRQVLGFLQNLPGRLVGMDAVEVNPRFDVHDRTAILAGHLVREAMGVAKEGRVIIS